jgi:hypothetical protein
MVILGDWYLVGNEGIYSGSTVPIVLAGGDTFFTYGNNNVQSEFYVTYNPNFVDFYSAIRFSTKNNANVDYSSLFQSIGNYGGTISLTQNGNTARFTFISGLTLVNGQQGQQTVTFSWFSGLGGVTQTQQSPVPFVKNVPITITIRG